MRACAAGMADADWSFSGYKCSEVTCFLVEALVLACGNLFNLSDLTCQTKDVLFDVACLLFARVAAGSKPLTDQLVAILAQLVFFFRFHAGCDLPEYAVFMGVVGINRSKRLLSNATLLQLNVVCTCEVVCFHLDVLHHYCSQYDASLLQSVKVSALACITVLDDAAVLNHYMLLDW